MDPITLATVTSAVSVLASECAKGAASDAGKDLWARIKSLLSWSKDPELADLAPLLAKQLSANEKLALNIVELLKGSPEAETVAGKLVGRIDAQKVIVAGRIEVSGDFKM